MTSFVIKKPFLVFLAILAVVGVLYVSAGAVRSSVSSLLSPVQIVLWKGGTAVSGFLEGVFSGGVKEVELEALRDEREALRQEVILLSQVREENMRLRETLNIAAEEPWNLVFATIVGKEAGADVLFLNKGSVDGIAEGMPVINHNKVAVGSVKTVFKHTSAVSLLSLKGRVFDVALVGKDIVGILRGQGGYEAVVDLIPSEADLVPGDVLATSALGGVFPDGLLVGKVQDVSKSDISAFQGGTVELFFTVAEANSLFVITNLK